MSKQTAGLKQMWIISGCNVLSMQENAQSLLDNVI